MHFPHVSVKLLKPTAKAVEVYRQGEVQRSVSRDTGGITDSYCAVTGGITDSYCADTGGITDSYQVQRPQS